jgi:uncharacterized protein (DUF1501 family)
MNRRDFLKAGSLGTASLALSGMPVKAFADTTGKLKKIRGNSDRIFVFVVLSGGNDGLNTVIPKDRYSELANARNNILIPSNQVLSLSGTSTTGLHPAMTGLRDMYNTGLVNITQGVGYPNFDYSHFRATDIYNTASDANVILNDGWLGRYLDHRFPGAPNAFPNADFLDPLAIQISTSLSTSLTGPSGQIGFALSDINNFYQIVNGVVDPAPNTLAGHELTYIRYISLQTQSYTQSIQTAANLGNNLSTKWANITGNNTNDLADQLKIVSKLISGGLQTPIYIVEIGGFDSHANQVNATDHATGYHAGLLRNLSDALEAFYDDLKLLGKDDKVAGCTISEFGRRIKSNTSDGSDHGSSMPLISFGKNVISGINGTSPNIPSNATVYDQLPMQYDFREVYSSILQDWFGLDAPATQNILNGGSFNTIPIFKKLPNTGTSIDTDTVTKEASTRVFPNPIRNYASLEFNSPGGHAQVVLYNESGQAVRLLYENKVAAGWTSFAIERNNLQAGNYYYVVMVDGFKEEGKMVFVD